MEKVKLVAGVVALEALIAGFHVVSRAALDMGVSKMAFLVYRNVSALAVVAPFAYLLENPRWRALKVCAGELFAPHRLDTHSSLRRDKARQLVSHVVGSMAMQDGAAMEKVMLVLGVLALEALIAGFHVVSRAALNMGVSKMVFLVYRNISALAVVAPFAYVLEK
ncbi:hypothetical protein EJB05_44790, partial [Eragrostis curvula]